MCFDEIYNFCLKYFSKFLLFPKINMKNHNFYEFFNFTICFGDQIGKTCPKTGDSRFKP